MGVLSSVKNFLGYGDPNRDDYDLPGFEDRQSGLAGEIGAAGQVGAPSMQAGRIGGFQNAGMGGQFRQGQLGLIGQLQQQANGQGPSLATGQFNQALDQGMAAQMAQANTGTGNTALAGRMAAQNVGGMTQNLAGQAAQARIQEQMNARAQLGGILGQGRSQEMQGGQFNAGQQNQRTLAQAGFDQNANQFNADAELRNRAQQNQYGLGLRDLELSNARGQQSGNQAYAGAKKDTFGRALLSGAGSLLANGVSGGMFNWDDGFELGNTQEIPGGLG